MASKPKDSLDVLQSMLVQTGKALKAAVRDGARGSGQVTTSLKPKVEASATVFHAALDDIECEIIAAKSVLMRDLHVLRAKKVPVKQTPVPVPVIPHVPQKQAPAAPMGVDMGSASPKISITPIRPPQLSAIQKVNTTAAASAAAQKKESKPAAPFPDMGISVGSIDGASAIPLDMTAPINVKTASPKVGSKPNPKPAAHRQQPKPSAAARTAPMEIGSSSAPGMSGNITTTAATNSNATAPVVTTESFSSSSALPFTDYEFSLAPSSDPIDLTAESSGPDPPASSVSIGGGGGGGIGNFGFGGGQSVAAASAAATLPHQPPNPAAAVPAPMGFPSGPSTAANPVKKAAEKPPAVNDDLYNLGDGGGMDLGPDMGGGGVDSNQFEDMYFGDDGYDDTAAYLGLE
ncbi:hypothetical protein MKZ38_010754 [Zalerion maritima]|uniref:Uncharacterized protein n=1 Tax=Zalerion maritima TaxID=339359 RepID=A0AAD5WV71_9PEZI|nr:hypothetical protein MKZ38_010754 [Zalerion maritima]